MAPALFVEFSHKKKEVAIIFLIYFYYYIPESALQHFYEPAVHPCYGRYPKRPCCTIPVRLMMSWLIVATVRSRQRSLANPTGAGRCEWINIICIWMTVKETSGRHSYTSSSTMNWRWHLLECDYTNVHVHIQIRYNHMAACTRRLKIMILNGNLSRLLGDVFCFAFFFSRPSKCFTCSKYIRTRRRRSFFFSSRIYLKRGGETSAFIDCNALMAPRCYKSHVLLVPKSKRWS